MMTSSQELSRDNQEMIIVQLGVSRNTQVMMTTSTLQCQNLKCSYLFSPYGTNHVFVTKLEF